MRDGFCFLMFVVVIMAFVAILGEAMILNSSAVFFVETVVVVVGIVVYLLAFTVLGQQWLIERLAYIAYRLEQQARRRPGRI